MQQNIDEQQYYDKQKKRLSISRAYMLQRWVFRLYICIVLLLLFILVVGALASKTAWGAFIVSSAMPWQLILPGALVVGFLFIFTDTFIQSREEEWFRYYGSQIIATVVAFDEVYIWRWARRFFSVNEYRLKLEWTSPQSGQVYHFSRRVRDSKLPTQGAQIPVLIDPADPTYYLQEDFKRSYD
ncbi:hypothetical protein [Dictyobacter kobayashii]|uniref:Uncharacterized protein n=1 Tax=Dictyobacter kobayashii TaxID=2014872 RepID=A0A402AUV7_9CHLR|nr:hypothetical protein [Dictyobacter kobayashii]GCE22839.1 hypothetical protein KDK_66390 [Dictyobacter kobayashii]